MSDGKIIALCIVGFVAAFGLLIAGGFALSWHSAHVECLRLHEQTGNPTRMAGSAFGGECYIQVDDHWIPADRYRGFQDGGPL